MLFRLSFTAQAEQGREKLIRWCEKGGYKAAAETLDRERLVGFYQFPKESRPSREKHLQTTNLIESPLAALRLRTDAAKRFPSGLSAGISFTKKIPKKIPIQPPVGGSWIVRRVIPRLTHREGLFTNQR